MTTWVFIILLFNGDVPAPGNEPQPFAEVRVRTGDEQSCRYFHDTAMKAIRFSPVTAKTVLACTPEVDA